MDNLKTQQLQHFHGNTAKERKFCLDNFCRADDTATNAFFLDKENEASGKCTFQYPPQASRPANSQLVSCPKARRPSESSAHLY